MAISKADQEEKQTREAALAKRFEGIAPKVEKVSEEHSCALNDVEWNNRAQELADAHRKTESEKQRKKDVMAEINADVKAAESRETKLANIVATRREQRDVVVEVTYDYEKGIVSKVRTDTKEEISSREMTSNERQTGLFDTEAVDANDLIESRHEETTTKDSEEE